MGLFYCSWKVTCLFAYQPLRKVPSDFLRCGQTTIQYFPAVFEVLKKLFPFISMANPFAA